MCQNTFLYAIRQVSTVGQNTTQYGYVAPVLASVIYKTLIWLFPALLSLSLKECSSSLHTYPY